MTKKEIQKYNIYLDEYYGNMEDLIEEHLMVMEESDGTKYAVVEVRDLVMISEYYNHIKYTKKQRIGNLSKKLQKLNETKTK